MREPLVKMTLEAEGTQLIVRTQVTLEQARVLLGFVRGALAPPPPPSGQPMPPPASPRPKAPALSPASP
jgi:hypothetical protein